MNAIEEKIYSRSRQKLHFEDEVMDFCLSQFMSYASFSGSQIGECLRAASQIEDGDPQSWTKAWQHMAQQVEAHAMAALDDGHLISSREAYLRAFTYYRAAMVFLHPSNRSYLDIWEDMRSCFRMAAALTHPPIKHVEIPYEQSILPGYFMRASSDDIPRPTLINIGGSETFAEELYFWSAAPGAIRGYNTLFVELPGQGSTPLNGQFYCVNAELPMKAVVDYALTLPCVDPDRLYAYGVSGGGYMVARAAAYDKRIKACVLNAPATNIFKLIADLPEDAFHPGENTIHSGHIMHPSSATTRVLLDKLCWQAGTTCFAEARALSRWAHMGELVCSIECPTFVLVSENESEERNRQTREFYSDLNAPKQMRVFTAEEGADAHCQANNLSLMQAAVFDWLDEL